MTPEDLNQIRIVIREEIREEIGGVEKRLREEIREEIGGVEKRLREEIGGVEKRLREEIGGVEKRMIERQDRAVEALTINLSELRAELTSRIAELGNRIDNLEKRVDNLGLVVLSIDARMTGFARSLDSLIKDDTRTAGTLAGQQRAFDALEARVKALEQKLAGHGTQPQ